MAVCARGVPGVKAPQFGLVDRRGIKLCAGYATKFNLRHTHTHTALSALRARTDTFIIRYRWFSEVAIQIGLRPANRVPRLFNMLNVAAHLFRSFEIPHLRGNYSHSRKFLRIHLAACTGSCTGFHNFSIHVHLRARFQTTCNISKARGRAKLFKTIRQTFIPFIAACRREKLSISCACVKYLTFWTRPNWSNVRFFIQGYADEVAWFHWGRPMGNRSSELI